MIEAAESEKRDGSDREEIGPPTVENAKSLHEDAQSLDGDTESLYFDALCYPPTLQNEEKKIEIELALLEPVKARGVGRDGNCLFRCISLALTNSEDHHLKCRKAINEHVNNNRKVYEPYIDNFDKHIGDMAKSDGKPTSWGTEAEIRAATDLYMKRIEVYSKVNDQWIKQIFNENEIEDREDNTWRLKLENSHYDLLQKKRAVTGEISIKNHLDYTEERKEDEQKQNNAPYTISLRAVSDPKPRWGLSTIRGRNRPRFDGDDDHYVTGLVPGLPAHECGRIRTHDTLL